MNPANKPTFIPGDKVLINWPGMRPTFGTIVSGPQTSRGHKYLVAFDGGYILNGKDCPQFMHEDQLSPRPDIPLTKDSALLMEQLNDSVERFNRGSHIKGNQP